MRSESRSGGRGGGLLLGMRGALPIEALFDVKSGVIVMRDGRQSVLFREVLAGCLSTHTHTYRERAREREEQSRFQQFPYFS